MRFSEIQKKEVIDTTKGSFLGYVQDATIDIVNGKLNHCILVMVIRDFFFDSKTERTKKNSSFKT